MMETFNRFDRALWTSTLTCDRDLGWFADTRHILLVLVQDLKDFGREAGNVSFADIDREVPGQGYIASVGCCSLC
jgi:hypothetical protein